MPVWTTISYKHLDTTTAPPNSPYRNVRFSIARNGTSVLMKKAMDGNTWETDGEAETIGDLGSSDKTCTIEFIGGEIRITNGKDKGWKKTSISETAVAI